VDAPERQQPSVDLRGRLVAIALDWERDYGVAPAITSALSEYDAARLVGMSNSEYIADRVDRTAVAKGYDFRFRGLRYQVKANRPSGRPGSFVTLVSAAKNYDWDRLIWLLYDREYRLAEAWLWEVEEYRARLGLLKRLGPREMRLGHRLDLPAAV
jgi:hypothetical protein